MKLYSGPLSLFSRKVEIALHEKGLAFDREMVAFTQATGYSPKHPAVLSVAIVGISPERDLAGYGDVAVEVRPAVAPGSSPGEPAAGVVFSPDIANGGTR